MAVYRLVDSHAHLEELENLESALDRARHVGVTAIIAVGSSHHSNQQVLRISERYPSFVYPALGLHPWELGSIEAAQIDDTLRFIEENIANIVAIGEIGLDYDKRITRASPKEQQRGIFQRLLAIARQYEKPVIIHSRYAWSDSFALVTEAKVEKAVFHWYTGFSSTLRGILEEGYFISATPATEYHEEHRRAVKATPLQNLLLETDCPVLYGKETRYRSEPADIIRSLKAVSALKGLAEATVAEQTTRNAIVFLGLDDL